MCALLRDGVHASLVFSQKEFPDKEKKNFLINRTEHPRLAERVRCLCVGCGATWGPPCQALVTRLLQIVGDEPKVIGSHRTAIITQTAQYTADLTWFGVRPMSTGDLECIFI